MNTTTVACHTCGETWPLAGTWSDYEREAMESRPCPHCDAYTLSLPAPTAAKSKRLALWGGKRSLARAA